MELTEATGKVEKRPDLASGDAVATGGGGEGDEEGEEDKTRGAGAEGRRKSRKSAFWFFVDVCWREWRRKYPDEDKEFIPQELQPKAQMRWKTMTSNQKEPFKELVKKYYKDRKKYSRHESKRSKREKGHLNKTRTEVLETVESGLNIGQNRDMLMATEMEAEKGKKRKTSKDPDEPKKCATPFFRFYNEKKPGVVAEMKGAKPAEVKVELTRRWKDSSQAVKGEYQAIFEREKERYEKELKAFRDIKRSESGPPSKVLKYDLKKNSFRGERQEEEESLKLNEDAVKVKDEDLEVMKEEVVETSPQVVIGKPRKEEREEPEEGEIVDD